MLLNTDPIKQVIEVCFSHKRDKLVCLPLNFNNNDVQAPSRQKHLGSLLDSKRNFNKHVNNKTNKCNKSKGYMKNFFWLYQKMGCWLFRKMLPGFFLIMHI